MNEHVSRRHEARSYIDPEGELLAEFAGALSSSHMHDIFCIAMRFVDKVNEMIDAGDDDDEILDTAHDVSVHVLSVALMAVIARHELPYDKAVTFAAGALDEFLPMMRRSVKWRIDAWIRDSRAASRRKGEGDDRQTGAVSA